MVMWPRYALVAFIVAQVRIRLMAVIAAVLCLGLATACEKTVPGTVAQTTQPGAPLTTTRTSTTTTKTSSPRTTTTRTSTPTSEVPAPANAQTMTCKEYADLDDATRKAVVKAILDQEKDSPFGMLGEDFAESMATTMCQFLPDATVKEVLMGSPPP
jgi:hypothetical protein